MKIALPVRAKLHKGCAVLLSDDRKGANLIADLFKKKDDKEARLGKELFLNAVLELQEREKTFKQLGSIFVLVEAIFESQNGRKPTEEEKYDLYLDLLEEYADRVPSSLSPTKTRAVHLSESNTVSAAHFIDGLMYHLCTVCDLERDLQATVSQVLWAWISWRGTLKEDPLDYGDEEMTTLVSEAEWREKHPFSEASGEGGDIARAHIVSRGADVADIEKSWNWIALTPSEHSLQHTVGWDAFLAKYPHLRGRVERARELAKKLPLEAGVGQWAKQALATDLDNL
jgi:hypothetical protein